MAALRIREFTDPACPFAFSAEPVRWRLRWLYGDQIEWELRMIVLSRSPDEYLAKGFTPERQAAALADLQHRYGMPIDPRPRPRMIATIHACRAVVATRIHCPQHERRLLRELRRRAMRGQLIDDPGVIARAARAAGMDPFAIFRWWEDDPAVEGALRADMNAARAPSPETLALRHKLAATDDGNHRYTCPTYEIERLDGGGRIDVPGFHPAEAYEVAIANLAPELERRPVASSVREVLAWAGEPLATAEVAAICDLSHEEARTELARVADENAVGADGWWTERRVTHQLAAA